MKLLIFFLKCVPFTKVVAILLDRTTIHPVSCSVQEPKVSPNFSPPAAKPTSNLSKQLILSPKTYPESHCLSLPALLQPCLKTPSALTCPSAMSAHWPFVSKSTALSSFLNSGANGIFLEHKSHAFFRELLYKSSYITSLTLAHQPFVVQP